MSTKTFNANPVRGRVDMLTQSVIDGELSPIVLARMAREMIYKPYPVIGGVGVISGIALGAIDNENTILRQEGHMGLAQYMNSTTLTNQLEQLLANPMLPMYTKLTVFLSYYEWRPHDRR